ncbi:Similar to mael: Protein maelstrom homolog (Culex quinquefasciatus) [Cotesia congregata]|uniref:Similar to mael: Protein maelstrom homolog (Culex quinquefasciatus) n=1 Tax=Cotesia congregata TaxID=51543 RepID=A0A8J2MKU1_COTCN|nr:Similar to mael: Protein maelstrom homolog (Culex quinquefasciatus) [Cotesia congregata]
MPEKKKKSGFYYFMLDFKKAEENNAMFNFIQFALSFAEKKRYNEMAKYKRGGGNSEEKLTGIGESLKLVEKREQERHLQETPFYIIHVNWYYTKTNVEDNSVDYIPAEFAVVEFRLNEGIKRIYQDILKIKIETGYTREAMEHSDATHKIDVNNNVPETKFEDLYTKFHNFLTSQDRPTLSASGQKLPILYTTRRIENVVRCFLNRMTEAAGVPHNTFNLYSLDYLFGTLMMHLNDNFPKESNRASLAEAEFDKDAFIFTSNIECAYHRNIEGTSEHCSQSVVTQWSYAICDYCCLILGINMINGKHRPYRIDEEVASGVHGMTIKKVEKVSVIKSETGVSEAYRLKVSERSRKEEELRKKQGKDILFIDHSQIQKPKPTVVISSAASSTSSYGSADTSRTLRPPSTISEIVKGSASSLVLDNCRDFPALDESRKSRQFKKL